MAAMQIAMYTPGYRRLNSVIILPDRQTDRQNVLFAIKITNVMINKETVKGRRSPLRLKQSLAWRPLA